jgi:hypothetical protein
MARGIFFSGATAPARHLEHLSMISSEGRLPEVPAVLLLGKRRKCMAMLYPVVPPVKKASYCYEGYREAWNLLTKSRSELLQWQMKPQD